jgi:hypothetical protein
MFRPFYVIVCHPSLHAKSSTTSLTLENYSCGRCISSAESFWEQWCGEYAVSSHQCFLTCVFALRRVTQTYTAQAYKGCEQTVKNLYRLMQVVDGTIASPGKKEVVSCRAACCNSASSEQGTRQSGPENVLLLSHDLCVHIRKPSIPGKSSCARNYVMMVTCFHSSGGREKARV